MMKIINYVFLLLLLFAPSMIQTVCFTDSSKYIFVGCFNDNGIRAIPNFMFKVGKTFTDIEDC